MARKQLVDINMNSRKITNLPTPTDAGDAVPKSYVDALPTGGGGDVVSDTSPQLGGDLDSNTHNILMADANYVQFGDAQMQMLGNTATIGQGAILFTGTTPTMQRSLYFSGPVSIYSNAGATGHGISAPELTMYETEVQIRANGVSDAILSVNMDAGMQIASNNTYARLQTENLTTLRTFQFPNADGTLATQEYVTANAGTGGGLVADEATLTFVETQHASALIAAANAKVTTADVVVIGDSSVEGHGADSWFHRLPLAVGAQLGEQGYHIVLGNINAFADKPISFSGNAGTVAQDGTEGRGWACRNAVIRDATGTITVTFEGDSFDMYYTVYSGGPTINVSVDGGTATVISTNEATTNRFKIWTGPTLNYGRHTVTITRPSGSGYAYVNGIRAYKGDRTVGVRVWDGGHAGYTTASYLAQEPQWGPGITTIQPDLVIISIGGNDLVDARTPAAAAADYKAIVDAIKARCTLAPQVVATPLSRHGSTTQVAWDAMEAAFKAMAATEGYMWIDSTEMLPVPEHPRSLYWTDNTHLGSIGQAVHAAALTKRLGITPISSDYLIPEFTRVIHGATASTPRPRAVHVEWVGSVTPTNATTSDTWIDTA